MHGVWSPRDTNLGQGFDVPRTSLHRALRDDHSRSSANKSTCADFLSRKRAEISSICGAERPRFEHRLLRQARSRCFFPFQSMECPLQHCSLVLAIRGNVQQWSVGLCLHASICIDTYGGGEEVGSCNVNMNTHTSVRVARRPSATILSGSSGTVIPAHVFNAFVTTHCKRYGCTFRTHASITRSDARKSCVVTSEYWDKARQMASIAVVATCNLNQWAMDFTGNLDRIRMSIA